MSDVDMPDSGLPLPEEAGSEELGDDGLDEDSSLDGDYEIPTDEPPDENPRNVYPHLREISSLASWTVSSHKPGCGVAALRQPTTEAFWQSDGPQPHTLTLHFARRAKIAHMRLHSNHVLDESYTPTKIQIWAGTGYHDLILVTEINLLSPNGWLPVDLSNAGGPSEFSPDDDPYESAINNGEDIGNSDEDEAETQQHLANGSVPPLELLTKRRRRTNLKTGRGPTLRCFLVQVRILENHQNGKDTHLRGFQVFAKDHEAIGHRQRAGLNEENDAPAKPGSREAAVQSKKTKQDVAMDRLGASLRKPEWMDMPELR